MLRTSRSEMVVSLRVIASVTAFVFLHVAILQAQTQEQLTTKTNADGAQGSAATRRSECNANIELMGTELGYANFYRALCVAADATTAQLAPGDEDMADGNFYQNIAQQYDGWGDDNWIPAETQKSLGDDKWNDELWSQACTFYTNSIPLHTLADSDYFEAATNYEYAACSYSAATTFFQYLLSQL